MKKILSVLSYLLHIVTKVLDIFGLLSFLPGGEWKEELIYGIVKIENGKETIIPDDTNMPHYRDLPNNFNGMNGDKVIIGRLYKNHQDPILESFINTQTMKNNGVDLDAFDNDYQAMSKKIIDYLKDHTFMYIMNVVVVIIMYISITYAVGGATKSREEFLKAEIPLYYLFLGYVFICTRMFLIRKYHNVLITYGKAFLNFAIINSILMLSILFAQEYYKPYALYNGGVLLLLCLGYHFIVQRRYLKLAINELEFHKKSLYKNLQKQGYLYKYDLIADESVTYYLQEISRFADTDYSLLLVGETGSGKGFYAELINEIWRDGKSTERGLPPTGKNIKEEVFKKRQKGKYIPINCSTLTENLAGSDLFGHVAGAFTGAINKRDGAIKSASGGILFLDELGELPKNVQGQLLTFMESDEIRAVGSDKMESVNVRIIAATDKPSNLSEPLKNRFDKIIKIPPLRHRKEDIHTLAKILFKKIYDKSGFSETSRRFKDDEIIKLLEEELNLSGNVRQLEKAIISALVMGKVDESTKSILAEDVIREAFKIEKL